MPEIWKKIKYAENYEVSDLGNIRSLKRGNRLLTIDYDRLKKTKTRARPGLSVNGKLKQYYLHRIVAEHFIDNPNNFPEVNHKDGNYHNNKAENLEWTTKVANMKHANENKLMTRYTRSVIVKDRETEKEQIYTSVSECAKSLGYSCGTISLTCSGKRKDKKYDMCYQEKEPDNVKEGSIWKEYPESDKYLVSTCGQVKNKKSGRLMMGSKVNGYRFVNLFLDREKSKLNRLIHRMVAQTFIPNPENKQLVNHIDANILNNCVENLEWVTYKENMNSAETLINLKKGKASHIEKVGNPVLQISIDTGEIVRKMRGCYDAHLYNLKSGTVSNVAYYYNYINSGKKAKITAKTFDKKYIFIFEKDKEAISRFLEIAREALNNPVIERKNIQQWNKEKTQLLAEYKSIYEASKKLNINYSGISQCCNYYLYNDSDRPQCYKLKTFKGSVFTFVKE